MINAPFSVLQSLAGSKCADSTTAAKAEYAAWMNEKYQELWDSYNWKETFAIDEEGTLTSGQAFHTLPKAIGDVFAITERTLDVVLGHESPRIFSEKYIADAAASNSPIAYTYAGVVGLPSKLTANAQISVVSSSAADTSINVRITGKNSSGIIVSETITLTGVTPATGTITWSKDYFIESVVKGALTTGTITISEVGGSALDYIAPRDYSNRYILIRTQALPSTTYTIYVMGKKPFKGLEYDEDIPIFPCGNILVSHAVVQKKKKLHDDAGAATEEANIARFTHSLVTGKQVLSQSEESTVPHFEWNQDDDLPLHNQY